MNAKVAMCSVTQELTNIDDGCFLYILKYPNVKEEVDDSELGMDFEKMRIAHENMTLPEVEWVFVALSAPEPYNHGGITCLEYNKHPERFLDRMRHKHWFDEDKFSEFISRIVITIPA